jgi:endogenous inhibitor of DNA gyrase (YacG/DUF329 family)
VPTTVRCPTCDAAVVWDADARWKPFCSERCRLIDLHGWFSEERALPADEPGSGLDS